MVGTALGIFRSELSANARENVQINTVVAGMGGGGRSGGGRCSRTPWSWSLGAKNSLSVEAPPSRLLGNPYG